MKKVPHYWWEFKGENKIIVESDNDNFPIVKVFEYIEDAESAITLAEKLIQDLKSGRKNPRKC